MSAAERITAPKSAFVVAAILALAVLYAILQIAVVRPAMPAVLTPTVARPPVAAGASIDSLRAWRTSYYGGPAFAEAPAGQPADPRTQGPKDPGTQGPSWAAAHTGTIVQVTVFLGAAIALFVLRSGDRTAELIILALALSAIADG